MSTVTTGSLCLCRCNSWLFAWTVDTTFVEIVQFESRETRSSPFAYKGHEVHLRLTKDIIFGNRYAFHLYLYTPPSFPSLSSLSKEDVIVRVETKNKTPLDLPNNFYVYNLNIYWRSQSTLCWRYYEDRILAKYPDFLKDGGILTFLVCNVDPPKVLNAAAFQRAEKLVQTPEHFNNASSLEGLSFLLQNQDSGQDLELMCGEGHSIKVHKNIVSARSKVISAMLNSDMSEGRTGRIEIKDMSHEVFDQFVRYLYAGKLSLLNVDIARGLYEAGDKYEVANLMKPCARFLQEKLTPDNACEMLVLADSHSDQEFKERVIDFIVEYEVFLQDDHWLPFHDGYPKLSSEVLYRFCKRQRKE